VKDCKHNGGFDIGYYQRMKMQENNDKMAATAIVAYNELSALIFVLFCDTDLVFEMTLVKM